MLQFLAKFIEQIKNYCKMNELTFDVDLSTFWFDFLIFDQVKFTNYILYSAFYGY